MTSREARRAALERQLDKYEGETLTPKQCAKIIGISRKKVDDLIDKGILKAFPVDPTAKERQHRKVVKADLIAYMLNN